MKTATETCENCGRAIGKLESVYTHKDHVVCRACWDRLHESAISYATPSVGPAHVYTTNIQTTQATGKFWKMQIALSTLVCISSVVLISIGASRTVSGSHEMHPATVLGILGLVLGIAWFIAARIGAWWFHG